MVHVPSGYDAESPMPLVLSFHGRHGRGVDQATLTGLGEVADRHGFIVVYPDGVGRSWNAMHGSGPAEELGVDDVGFVDALIDRLQTDHAIDPKRVYAVGMSNGGFFSHRLGCELSTRLAAIASVAGQMGPKLAEVCRPEEPIAVLDIHGTRDPIVPYEGGETKGGGRLLSAEDTVETWRRLNGCATRSSVTLETGDVRCRAYAGCSAPVELCTIEGGGHTWPGGHQYLPRLLVGTTNRDIDASELIWEFFERNPKGTPVGRGSGSTPPAVRRRQGLRNPQPGAADRRFVSRGHTGGWADSNGLTPPGRPARSREDTGTESPHNGPWLSCVHETSAPTSPPGVASTPSCGAR